MYSPSPVGDPPVQQQQEQRSRYVSKLNSEPVEALDLRIGKANESIQHFNINNVLGSANDTSVRSRTDSGGGPVDSIRDRRDDRKPPLPYIKRRYPTFAYSPPQNGESPFPGAGRHPAMSPPPTSPPTPSQQRMDYYRSPSPPPPDYRMPSSPSPLRSLRDFRRNYPTPQEPQHRYLSSPPDSKSWQTTQSPHTPSVRSPQYLAEHLRSPDPTLPRLPSPEMRFKSSPQPSPAMIREPTPPLPVPHVLRERSPQNMLLERSPQHMMRERSPPRSYQSRQVFLQAHLDRIRDQEEYQRSSEDFGRGSEFQRRPEQDYRPVLNGDHQRVEIKDERITPPPYMMNSQVRDPSPESYRYSRSARSPSPFRVGEPTSYKHALLQRVHQYHMLQQRAERSEPPRDPAVRSSQTAIDLDQRLRLLEQSPFKRSPSPPQPHHDYNQKHRRSPPLWDQVQSRSMRSPPMYGHDRPVHQAAPPPPPPPHVSMYKSREGSGGDPGYDSEGESEFGRPRLPPLRSSPPDPMDRSIAGPSLPNRTAASLLWYHHQKNRVNAAAAAAAAAMRNGGPIASTSGDFSCPSTSTGPMLLPSKGKRGRPRKHAPKIPLPPLYVFIRNLLHNGAYNPKVVSWVNETVGIFKVNNTNDFAKTWGRMKSNRSEEMNYEKMSRAMRYHYGNEKQGRKGHLAMVKEKRLVYRFGELAINWRPQEVEQKNCEIHELCKGSLCLWTKE